MPVETNDLTSPFLLFLGATKEEGFAKTAFGLVEWCPGKCAGQMRLPGCVVDLGLDERTPEEVVAEYGKGTLVVGVANLGGYIPEDWVEPLCRALEAGLDIAAGMHTRLNKIDRLRQTAIAHGRRLIDVRHSGKTQKVGTGRKRTGKRLLTVAADCAIGKKYAALAIAKEMESRGLNAAFRATGQTGILIAGSGIAVDTVVADFISGAAEAMSPDNDDDHWDVVEGQGSLFHPSYAGVAIGLLHGSQPDALVVCHDPGRTKIAHIEADFTLPDIETVMRRNIEAAQLTNPDVRVVGVAVNTSKMTVNEAQACLHTMNERIGVPVCDPVRTGVAAIVDYLLEIGEQK